MKTYFITVAVSLISLNAYADSVANAAAIAATQSAVNTGMMVYWQGQGVQSNIVSLPNGTAYVVPQVNNPKAPQTTPINPYENQNNQSNKQAFAD